MHGQRINVEPFLNNSLFEVGFSDLNNKASLLVQSKYSYIGRDFKSSVFRKHHILVYY